MVAERADMPPQERIPERICGHLGDIQLPRKVGSLVQDLANRAEVDDVNKRVEDVLEQIKIVISQMIVLIAVSSTNLRIDGLQHELHNSVDVVKAELLAKMQVEQSDRHAEEMTGGSYLQGGVGAALRRAVINSEKVSDTDRTSVLSSFSGASSDGDRYASQSGRLSGS